jgi:hypothetical protein
VSYKQFLMGRHSSFQEAESDASPLDYMQLRNRDALRDWQLRAARLAAAERTPSVPVTAAPALRPPTVRPAAIRVTKEAPHTSLAAAFMLQAEPELHGR